jgi:CheY-like chemotaxis protein
VKPVKPAELMANCRAALGRHMPDTVQPREVSADEPSELRRKILLAEDNLVNQRLATALLERMGHQVTIAVDGFEAVQKSSVIAFDVILMDVQMPGMDGFEATAAIRQRESATDGHTPVIAMTAHAMTGDRERCLSAGMDGYVSKPIRREQLSAEIERVLRTVAAGAGRE